MPNVPASRPNLYTIVHKGLRAHMADTLALAGRTDASDADAIAALVAQAEELLLVCRVHLEDENRFIHPAMEARAPGSSTAVADDHAHHEEAIDALSAQLEALAAGPDRAAVLERFYGQLALFVAENLEHMHIEETQHNAVLWATHTDEELRGIEHAIVTSIAPEAMVVFQKWMIPAMSHAERVEMFTGMRDGAPPEVLAGALELAHARLSARDYHALTQSLRVAA